MNKINVPNPHHVDEIMRFYAEAPWSFYVDSLGFALVTILLIPVITAVTGSLGHLNAGFVRWAAIIGYIGCAGTVMEAFRYLLFNPYRARIFLEGDELIQTVMRYSVVPDGMGLDGWMLFGAIGIWFFVVSIVALRHRRGEHPFSRAWSYLCLFSAVIHFVALASRAWPELVAPAGLIGGIIGAPLWSISTWRNLRRISNQHQGSETHRQAA